MVKKALITGITGQDGSYLARFLLDKNYDVHGLVRWDAIDGTQRLKDQGIQDQITLHYGDLTDALNIARLIQTIKPDEIYNLAALSHVHVSFETPASAFDINTKGTLNILETLRLMENAPKLYQASSSEMFGDSPPPQNENTPMHPCSAYGIAKLASYWLVRTYRDAYNLHASNGILFNHESPMRGEDFVTQKIIKAIAAIKTGNLDKLYLGNMDATRDWGHAKDYVRGMWMMLQQDTPDDYILATGQSHSVRDFATTAFKHIDLNLEWSGEGPNETATDQNGITRITIDPALFRPKEVNALRGDASKAKEILNWSPEISFEDLIKDMLEAELKKAAA